MQLVGVVVPVPSSSWSASSIKEVLLNGIGADPPILHGFHLRLVLRLLFHHFLPLEIENLFDGDELQADPLRLGRESRIEERG